MMATLEAVFRSERIVGSDMRLRCIERVLIGPDPEWQKWWQHREVREQWLRKWYYLMMETLTDE